MAAARGYHVVSIMYPDAPSVLACRAVDDAACFEKMRTEIVYGIDESDLVSVNAANCIMHRTLALLRYLARTRPSQGWDRFIGPQGPRFELISLAGHSQGAGHAAFIARRHPVRRVIVFSGPDDFSDCYQRPAPWTHRLSQTPASHFFGLLHLQDEVEPFANQLAVWRSLGLLATGDTVCADNGPPAGRFPHCFYSRLPPGDGTSFHNSTAVDAYLPMAGSTPRLAAVWNFMLTASPQATGRVRVRLLPPDVLRSIERLVRLGNARTPQPAAGGTGRADK